MEPQFRESPFSDHDARIAPWGNDVSDEQLFYRGRELGQGALTSIKDKLQRYGLCIIRREGAGFTTTAPTNEELSGDWVEIDPNLEALQQNLGRISSEQSGAPRPTAKLIVSDPQADKLSGNTLETLEVHADGSHLDIQPAIIILQYLVPADVGGALCFVDMAKILDSLHKDSPELLTQVLADLSAVDAIQTEKAVSGKTLTRTGPFFWKTPQRTIQSVACRARFDQKVVPHDRSRKMFEEIRKRVLADENRAYVVPEAGDVIAIDNWRVLHGRSRYMTLAKRKHRRLWIEALYPRAGIFLGIRPVTLPGNFPSESPKANHEQNPPVPIPRARRKPAPDAPSHSLLADIRGIRHTLEGIRTKLEKMIAFMEEPGRKVSEHHVATMHVKLKIAEFDFVHRLVSDLWVKVKGTTIIDQTIWVFPSGADLIGGPSRSVQDVILSYYRLLQWTESTQDFVNYLSACAGINPHDE